MTTCPINGSNDLSFEGKTPFKIFNLWLQSLCLNHYFDRFKLPFFFKSMSRNNISFIEAKHDNNHFFQTYLAKSVLNFPIYCCQREETITTRKFDNCGPPLLGSYCLGGNHYDLVPIIVIYVKREGFFIIFQV